MIKFRVIWKSITACYELGFYYAESKKGAITEAYLRHKDVFPKRSLYKAINVYYKGE